MWRVTLIPAIVLTGAWSFLTWLWSYSTRSLRPELVEKFDDCLGWTAPSMRESWDRLFQGSWDDVYHNLKNLGTEWMRMDAQRAFKFWAFIIALDAVLFALLEVF